MKPTTARVVACVLLAGAALVPAHPSAAAPSREPDRVATTKADSLGSVLGATVGGLLGIVGGVGFRLGLWDEFATSSASRPVTLGQVRTAVNADRARGAGWDGSGIDVALIDTGVVPVAGLDGADAVIGGPDLSFDRQSGLTAGLDGYGHGTHMAGIIASRGGTDAGLAPASRLVNLKVGASNGAVDVSQVIAAIDWVVQNRTANGLNIRVLNLSFGTDGVQAASVDPLAHAVESAWRNGIVVVVAAGNSGKALLNPAIDPFVLTVGAVDLKDPATPLDDEVASYSSVGTASRRVDLVAPGTSIISKRDPGSSIDDEHPEARVGTDGFRGSGTSQAAAVTSGVVASLLEARPTLGPDQVKSVLTRSAVRLPRSAPTSQGAGMIDLAGALAATPLAGGQAGTRSTGTGTLEGARGSVHVSLDGTELRGEIDVQSQRWVPSVWAPLSAAGRAWSGGTWNGALWAGDGFTSGAPTWSGRTWKDATWTGRTWKGDAWTGRTWRGETWTGRTWKST